jgi:hypothetical protein
MSLANKPCGCHDLNISDTADLAIPSLDEFEQSLQAISASTPAASGDLNELDLASLETSLAALDELSLDGFAEDGPQLGDLIRLLERYPGLKISLSF